MSKSALSVKVKAQPKKREKWSKEPAQEQRQTIPLLTPYKRIN